MSDESPEARLADAEAVIADGDATALRVAEALVEKAEALEELQRADEALACYERVVGDLEGVTDAEATDLVEAALTGMAWVLLDEDRAPEALDVSEKLLARLDRTHASPEDVADALYLRARTLSWLRRLDEAIACYDTAIAAALEDPEAKESLAHALRWKARALRRRGDLEAAVETVNDLVARFEDDADSAVREVVAYALGDNTRYLMALQRYEEGLRTVELALQRRADLDDAEEMAAALINRVLCLHALGRTAEQITAAEELIASYVDEPDPDVRRYVADGAYHRAHALLSLGRVDEAIPACQQIIDRYADDPDSELQRRVAQALYIKAYALVREGRRDEAVPVYDEILRRFGDAPEFRHDVARALLMKGSRLAERGEHAAALDLWDDVIRRYGDDTAADVQGEVASALERKATLLIEERDVDAAAATLDVLLARSGDDQARTSGALANKAYLLSGTERDAEAAVIQDSLLERLAVEQDPARLVVLAKGLMPRAMALFNEGNVDEAAEVSDAILKRCEPGSDPAYRRQAALALANKIEALGQLGDMDAAIAAHRRLVEDFGEEAVAAFDEAAAGARVSRDPRAAQSLAGALFKKGLMLSELGRQDEADQAFTEVIVRFENSDDEAIQRAVAAARESREGEGEG
jgi:tetratricopeptide (TPR) repeat protein